MFDRYFSEIREKDNEQDSTLEDAQNQIEQLSKDMTLKNDKMTKFMKEQVQKLETRITKVSEDFEEQLDKVSQLASHQVTIKDEQPVK